MDTDNLLGADVSLMHSLTGNQNLVVFNHTFGLLEVWSFEGFVTFQTSTERNLSSFGSWAQVAKLRSWRQRTPGAVGVCCPRPDG